MPLRRGCIRIVFVLRFLLEDSRLSCSENCKLVDSVWSTVFDVFACLLEGDDEEVYWCCGHLADRSIVVMDESGNYYHAEKEKEAIYNL